MYLIIKKIYIEEMENGNPWKDFEKRNNVVVQRVGAKEET